LVMRFGDEGSFSMISDARSAGGRGFADPAIERLQEKEQKMSLTYPCK
jgi:hypothetical protein